MNELGVWGGRRLYLTGWKRFLWIWPVVNYKREYNFWRRRNDSVMCFVDGELAARAGR